MITYVITVSEKFPTTHSRKGQETNFIRSIALKSKIHTIRGNYPLWAKRFEKIEKGEACLSVRVWTGKPYKSKQKEIFNLTNRDGIGIEKMELYGLFGNGRKSVTQSVASFEKLAKNDGLSFEDFKEWFKKAKPGDVMAIIHFTKFRYLKRLKQCKRCQH